MDKELLSWTIAFFLGFVHGGVLIWAWCESETVEDEVEDEDPAQVDQGGPLVVTLHVPEWSDGHGRESMDSGTSPDGGGGSSIAGPGPAPEPGDGQHSGNVDDGPLPSPAPFKRANKPLVLGVDRRPYYRGRRYAR